MEQFHESLRAAAESMAAARALLEAAAGRTARRRLGPEQAGEQRTQEQVVGCLVDALRGLDAANTALELARYAARGMGNPALGLCGVSRN